MANSYIAPPIPQAFIWRRAHSLTGLWLVIYLIEHLLTNSQAALYLGENGVGFIRAVNFIQSIPFLHEIEILLLGVPFFIHGLWGIKYLLTGKFNVFPSDGSSPYLPQYPRNGAYTWQRITSWILLFGITAHVIHMRFLEYPSSAQRGTKKEYMSRVEVDDGLYTLAERLGYRLYNREEIENISERIMSKPSLNFFTNDPQELIAMQKLREEQAYVAALKKRPLTDNELMAVTPSFGTAELLIVRDVFKSPLMIFLYSGLVLASCFHAFNGLWTFLISWGVTLTVRSQQIMRMLATLLMMVVAFLGLAAIWGTYWFNLKF